MKKLLIVVVAALILSASAAAQQKMDSIYFNYLEHKKSPGLAFCLSFILPAGGQFYNGDGGRALLIATCMIAGPIISLNAGFRDTTVYYSGFPVEEIERTPYFTLGLVLAGSAYLYSLFDAPARADHKNKALKRRLNLSATRDKVYLAYTF